MRGRGTLFRLVLYPGDDEMKENLHELLKNWGLEGRTIQEAKDTGAAIATGVWHLGPDYSLKTGGNFEGLRHHIHISRVLADQGITASCPLPTLDGKDFLSCGDHYFVITERVTDNFLSTKQNAAGQGTLLSGTLCARGTQLRRRAARRKQGFCRSHGLGRQGKRPHGKGVRHAVERHSQRLRGTFFRPFHGAFGIFRLRDQGGGVAQRCGGRSRRPVASPAASWPCLRCSWPGRRARLPFLRSFAAISALQRLFRTDSAPVPTPDADRGVFLCLNLPVA